MAAIVRVVNDGDKPIKLGWNGEQWVIAPRGGQEFVPMEAAVLAFGDPYLTDTAEIASRSEEWNRIRVRYGIYADLHKIEDGWSDPEKPEKTYPSLLPKVRVFTSQGEELPMLMHDPEGDIAKAKLASEATLDSTSDLILKRLDAIESENRALRDELSRRRLEAAQAPTMGEDAGPVMPAEAPVDHPDELDEFDGMSIEDMTAILNQRAAENTAADESEDDTPGAGISTDNPPTDTPAAARKPGRGRPLN